jgi:hypothetical protein
LGFYRLVSGDADSRQNRRSHMDHHPASRIIGTPTAGCNNRSAGAVPPTARGHPAAERTSITLSPDLDRQADNDPATVGECCAAFGDAFICR